jgi:formate hydrogenlyase subunit 4
MLKKIALVFGVVFVAVGLLGFVPAAAPDGHLLGLFHVNALHNVVHIASGAVALWAGLSSERNAKLYFQIFGVVYALVAVLGFVYGDQPILGLVANNAADTWLHVLIAAVALYLGFAMKTAQVNAAA